MLFIIRLLIIAVLSYLAELFFPWWSVVICAFFVGAIMRTRGINAFLSGFLGVGLLWLIAAWIIDAQSSAVLSEKVAAIFQLNQSVLIIVITAFTGAIVGGLGALSGNYFRDIFEPEKPKSRYY